MTTLMQYVYYQTCDWHFKYASKILNKLEQVHQKYQQEVFVCLFGILSFTFLSIYTLFLVSHQLKRLSLFSYFHSRLLSSLKTFHLLYFDEIQGNLTHFQVTNLTVCYFYILLWMYHTVKYYENLRLDKLRQLFTVLIT